MSKSGFIAIIGRPNAGKSTLLNAILGTKLSIVTPKAQTTRERVLGILTEEQGQIVFIDTPGIHRAKEGGINAYMMSEAQEALEAPSVIWYLVDPFSGVKHENTVLELLEKAAQVPVFLIISKWDVVRKHKKEEIIERFAQEMKEAAQARGIRVEKVLQLSAPKKLQLKELLSDSWVLLQEGPLFYPDEEMISDRPVRFFVAEKIREQLLLQLGDELPYSCAVEIEQFKEANPPVEKLTRIEATIHVERDSQKGMVIGKGGQKIKEIGQAARQEIEEFVGGPVFLGLRVKVLKDWSKNADALKRMGYDIAEKQKSGRRH